MLDFDDFRRVGGSMGSNPGGLYVRKSTGQEYYLKEPNSRRQLKNEIMAYRFYDLMGFSSVRYEEVDNGMVASRFTRGLPDRSEPDDLKQNETVQQVFMPSAWIANWDVIGLGYENTLYDPETMDNPMFLDFGGSFDTRAMGGDKPFKAGTIMAFDGFTDKGINHSATTVFENMPRGTFESSKQRVARVTRQQIENIVQDVGVDGATMRVEKLLARQEIIETASYDDVFL